MLAIIVCHKFYWHSQSGRIGNFQSCLHAATREAQTHVPHLPTRTSNVVAFLFQDTRVRISAARTTHSCRVKLVGLGEVGEINL